MSGGELRWPDSMESEGSDLAVNEPGPDSGPVRVEGRASTLKLVESRSLEVGDDGASFVVRSGDGTVELKVRITADGPVLCFSAAAIEIEKTTRLKLDVDEFDLRAKRQIRIQSYGDLSQIVAGNSVSHCEGRQDVHAGAFSVTSHRGEMCLDSSHELSIRGERVLINC